MKKLNALDRILSDDPHLFRESSTATSVKSADAEGATISMAARIRPGHSGVLAEIHRVDLTKEEERIELIRLKQDGTHSASLVLSETPDAAEARIASALIDTHQAALYTLADGVWSPSNNLERLATAATKLGLGPQDQVVLTDRHCAALNRESGEISAFSVSASPKEKSLDTAALAIGGWRTLTDIHVAGDMVYAAVADPVAGFDLFSCDLTGKKPGFKPLLDRGAHRFALNGAVAAMASCDDGLLIGTAALAGPAHPVGDWGPELLLVTPDGKWDLLAGLPRFSPAGLVLPASTQMPGMGQPENAAITSIATAGRNAVIALQSFTGDTCEDRREATADLLDYHGTIRLYRTSDLVDWEPLTHDLPEPLGKINSMCLTESAVFVGHETLDTDAIPVRVIPLG